MIDLLKRVVFATIVFFAIYNLLPSLMTGKSAFHPVSSSADVDDAEIVITGPNLLLRATELNRRRVSIDKCKISFAGVERAACEVYEQGSRIGELSLDYLESSPEIRLEIARRCNGFTSVNCLANVSGRVEIGLATNIVYVRNAKIEFRDLDHWYANR